MERNGIYVRYLRSNELYDIYEVIDRNGAATYPQFPRHSHISESDVLNMYAD